MGNEQLEYTGAFSLVERRKQAGPTTGMDLHTSTAFERHDAAYYEAFQAILLIHLDIFVRLGAPPIIGWFAKRLWFTYLQGVARLPPMKDYSTGSSDEDDGLDRASEAEEDASRTAMTADETDDSTASMRRRRVRFQTSQPIGIVHLPPIVYSLGSFDFPTSTFSIFDVISYGHMLQGQSPVAVQVVFAALRDPRVGHATLSSDVESGQRSSAP